MYTLSRFIGNMFFPLPEWLKASFLDTMTHSIPLFFQVIKQCECFALRNPLPPSPFLLPALHSDPKGWTEKPPTPLYRADQYQTDFNAALTRTHLECLSCHVDPVTIVVLLTHACLCLFAIHMRAHTHTALVLGALLWWSKTFISFLSEPLADSADSCSPAWPNGPAAGPDPGDDGWM